MKIIFDDTAVKESLWPLTATRNAADVRIGILTIREKWDWLIEPFRERIPDATMNAAIVPSGKSVAEVKNDGRIVLHEEKNITNVIRYPWDIFRLNDWAIRSDFEMITKGRRSQLISSANSLIAAENIFIEEGAIVECSTINASAGPVYIGRNATIMEGCLIRGPFALGEGAVLKMGAKIYGATTIGPYCIAGGEIKNSMLFGYSNKAHDGYLGDSVIGEWCNLGAGTTNSNVKNTAGEVKLWNKAVKQFISAGIKAGLIMGDYSRSAINTSFNTGSVVGICCNIFGEGFPPKLVADFTWGKERYVFEKAMQDIDNWKKLKGKSLTEKEKNNLYHLYKQSN